jgi:hypothetical protein
LNSDWKGDYINQQIKEWEDVKTYTTAVDEKAES